MILPFCLCLFLHAWLYSTVQLNRQMPLVLPQHTALEKVHSVFLPEEAFRWLCKSDVGIQSVSEEGSFQSPLLVPVFDSDWKFCRHIAGTRLACQLILCHLREAWRNRRENKGLTQPLQRQILQYYALLFADSLQTSSGIFLNLMLKGLVPYLSKQ